MTDTNRHTREAIEDAVSSIEWHEECLAHWTHLLGDPDTECEEKITWHKTELTFWKQELRWLTEH